MTAYFIIAALVSFFAYGSQFLKASAGVRNLSVFIVATLLILFQGLRDGSVGTDTLVYVRRFDFVTSIEDVWRSTEIGYNVINVLLSLLFESYSVLLLSIAIIVVGCYVVGIVKMTKHFALALFLFVMLGAYTFSFNAARQGIAVAFCFLALTFLLKRSRLRYFSLIGIAFLFHHTALIAAPLYFMSSEKVNWRHLVASIVGIVLLVAGLGSVVGLSAALLSDNYSTYAEVSEGGGEVMVSFLTLQGIFLYFLRPKRSHADKTVIYSRLFSIYLVGLIPAVASVIASVNPSGVLRLHSYFSHTAILLWPMALYQVKGERFRPLIAIGLVFFMLLFFYLTTANFSKLVPYRLNPEYFL